MLTTIALSLFVSLPAHAETTRPSELLMRLPPEAKTAADVDAFLKDVGHRAAVPLSIKRRTVAGWAVVRIAARTAQENEAAVAALARVTKGVQAITTMRPFRLPSDDFSAEYLWGMNLIEAPAAWDITVGEASQRIGVVDTGLLREHIEVADADVVGFDFIEDATNAEDGDGRDADYSDDSVDESGVSHGSHVAGTILARGDDGLGIAGVNWRAGLVSARALGREGGSIVDIMEAAAWMAGEAIDGVPSIGRDKVSVVNLSLGSNEACSEFEQDIIDHIRAHGVTVVAAAGNDSLPVGSPANCDGVIAVGAVGPDAARTAYSNFDSRIDVMAPGGDGSFGEEGMILSLAGVDPLSFVMAQGTSMAAPHVTGVVSLMQAVNPGLSPDQIEEILVASPYTCGDCDNEAFLTAGDAVRMARDAVPEQSTGDAPSAPGDDDVAETSPGADEPRGRPARSCDESRGNWDCHNGDACVDGECVEDEAGNNDLLELCEEDEDCDSGLCDRGVCTSPCDSGCADGFRCDEDKIPGGLCRAEDCSEDPDMCGDANCVLNDDDDHVCSVDQPVDRQGCAAAGLSGQGPALLGLLALLRRRRR